MTEKEENKPPKFSIAMLHVQNAAKIEDYEIKRRGKRQLIFPLSDIKFFDTLECGQPMFV